MSVGSFNSFALFCYVTDGEEVFVTGDSSEKMIGLSRYCEVKGARSVLLGKCISNVGKVKEYLLVFV
jgi:hypothetical protein